MEFGNRKRIGQHLRENQDGKISDILHFLLAKTVLILLAHLAQTTYAYDAAGNMVSKDYDDLVNAGNSRVYGYHHYYEDKMI